MTSEFSKHDLQNLQAMEAFLTARGLAKDQRGFQYNQHIDLHINPHIGGIKLAQLTTAAAINSFIDKLHEEDRSPKMIKKVLVSLGAIFKEARRRGLAVVIPTQDIDLDLPERDDPRAVIPTKAELQAIIAGARGRWRALIMARIGVMKALSHVERVFNPDRKETHWGKRKLKRDQ